MNIAIGVVGVVLIIIGIITIITLYGIKKVAEKTVPIDKILPEEFRLNREEYSRASKDLRMEISESSRINTESLVNTIQSMGSAQSDLMEKIDNRTKEHTESNIAEIRKISDMVRNQMKELQEGNEKKLDQMRQTVDEKLQKTLETRLGQSFQLVQDQLEKVYKGLGEMQTLAIGVGDLKKVLSNVKTRGTLGETRLGMILEQILAPEQYTKDVPTRKGSRETVEFAVKIPSKTSDDEFLFLPIDSKFPQDRYQAVLDAYEKADPDLVESALKELEKAIKTQAKDIRDKYINPPATTDFAIMFLPFEGLFAEVVRRPGLFETLQKEYRISIVGPANCAAFLHSLQMGFRTLAIEKRSSEVWTLLGAVKSEFGKFAGMLEGVKNNLVTATRKIDDAATKTRTIERKLRDVQSLPQGETVNILGESIEEEPENDRKEE